MNRQRTLAACILGSAVVFLDGTVVNVALPSISKDLGGGLSAQQWIVEAYLLTLGSLILVGGSLGDLLGRRRVFAIGVSGFGFFSLCCAIAPSPTILILARGLQGIAGALLVPSTLALIVDTFDERERGAAIGTWTAFTGVATVVGPLGGGALLEVASWRWIFAINVLPVLATLWLLRSAPAGHRRSDTPIDWVGAALCTLGLGGPVFALTEEPNRGWGDPLVLLPLVIGIALFAAFVVWEQRARDPMLPFVLFRSRNFTIGNLSTFTLYAGLNIAILYLVLYLQQVGGYSPLAAGAATLPMTLEMFTLSRRFGALSDRIGPRRLMGFGPLVAGVGLLLYLRLGTHPSYIKEVLPAVLVFGFGMSMTVAPLTATVLAGVNSEHAGIASGVNNAIARVAGLIAIAIAGVVIAGHVTGQIDQKLPPATLSPAAQHAVGQAAKKTIVATAPGTPADEQVRVNAALRESSQSGFRLVIGIAAVLAFIGGTVSLVGIEDPRRKVPCRDCPGGALVGASPDAARDDRPGQRTAAPSSA